MKYVSRHPGYNLTIVEDQQRAETLSNGVTRYVQSAAPIEAKFRVQTLSETEIKAATDQIYIALGPDAFGSHPGRDAGNMSVQDAVEEGYSSTAHDGFDIYQRLSSFDTADPTFCDPQDRELVEQFMENHYDKGLSYVRVDDYNLTPPWPTYPLGDEINVDGIVKFAVMGGLVGAALVFERNTLQRPNLVLALEEAQEQERIAAQQDAGLSATV